MHLGIAPLEKFFTAHPAHPELARRALEEARPYFEIILTDELNLVAKEEVDVSEALRLANAHLGLAVTSVAVLSLASLRADEAALKALDAQIADIDLHALLGAAMALLDAEEPPPEHLDRLMLAFEETYSKAERSAFFAPLPECVKLGVSVPAIVSMALVMYALTGDGEEIDRFIPLMRAGSRALFLGTYRDQPGTLVLLAA